MSQIAWFVGGVAVGFVVATAAFLGYLKCQEILSLHERGNAIDADFQKHFGRGPRV